MPSSGYASIVFTANEQPTTAKWNLIGSNDSSFNLGTGLEDSVILARHIAANVIQSGEVDWTTSGGIWYQELGRTTLGAVGNSINVAFTAKKYLQARFICIPSGSIVPTVQFNGDTGANYAERYNFSGTAGSSMSVQNIGNISNSGAWAVQGVIDIINLAAQVKLGRITGDEGNNVAATAPDYIDFWFKWINTSAQISSINLANTGAGNFAVGSEMVILGHD